MPCLLRVAKIELKLISTVKTTDKLKIQTPPTLKSSQIALYLIYLFIKITKYSYSGQRYKIWYIKPIKSSSDISNKIGPQCLT